MAEPTGDALASVQSREPDAKARLPWYRDLRFAIGFLAAPFFFFASNIVTFVAPGLTQGAAGQAEQATRFISGAVLLFPLAALIEDVTDYYEHNFHHRHDRYGALLRAGLMHASFTNFAFLALTVFALASANNAGAQSTLVRVVQISVAGSIVVSVLFNLGLALLIGGFNFKRHGGRLNFSKELANQDAEMLTIAVVILSLPTLASRLNINPSFLDPVNYRVQASTVTDLSVIVSGIMLFTYASYILWTVFKVGDVQGETTEDVQEDVLQTLFRAINRVFVAQGHVSLYEALRSPSVHYPDKETRQRDEEGIQQQMDNLDASLEADEEEDRAHQQRLKMENERRKRTYRRRSMSLAIPFLALRTGVAAVVFILVSPIVALYRLFTAPLRWQERRRQQKASIEEQHRGLPTEERERRLQRDQRRVHKEDELQHEPAIQVILRFARLIVGVAGAVFVLDRMANSIEGGLVEGLGWNPFFVGFIILPIAAGLVDITTAIRKAWNNEVQNAMAITAGSAVQSALLVAPLLLILSRLPFLQLADINLVFGLFILAVFALIAYFYQIMTVDGETTWFEGAQLLAIFGTVAVVVFFAQPS